MSSINGLGAYSPYMQYNWQSASSSSSSLGNAQTALTSMSGQGMLGQISSMVELTRYAMEQMGLDDNDRVTFSQISKYRNELSQSFDTELRSALSAAGIQNMNGLTFTLSPSGSITVQSDNASDKLAAQAYIDAHPELGQSLIKGISDEGVTLTLPASGSMTAEVAPQGNKDLQEKLQKALDEAELGQSLRDGLKAEGLIGASGSLSLSFDADGNLVVDPETENAEAINAWLAEQTEAVDALRAACKEAGVDETKASFTLTAAGELQASVSGQQAGKDELDAARAAFAKMSDEAKSLQDGLAALSIDLDAEFTIKINSDGTVTIGGVHPDVEKIQKVFDNNKDLVKTYSQIEALAGLDEARAAMNISPSAMRKTLQMESIAAAWWSGSMSNSYFGTYSGQNGLSLLSGLNMNI